ncbi:hypothetical protein F5Y11DRAFT_96511 [Daldinia sp. FL1419]|nr:hypothetical protein F5Y11DRAFT_96511 [Daldinia sp. FL1419]
MISALEKPLNAQVFFGAEEPLTERLLGALICLSYNLRSLFLSKTERTCYSILITVLQRAIEGGRYAILPRPLTLSIQELDNSSTRPRINISLASKLLQIASIHRLHVWRGDGYLKFSRFHHCLWMSGIRELRLIAYVNAHTIFRIFRAAQRLESFSLVVTKPWGFYEALPPLMGTGLNRALMMRANTLKALELRTCKNTFFLSQLGMYRILSCLPQLENLETLVVEIPLIAGITLKGCDLGIIEKLPPKLVSLEAIELWLFPEIDGYCRASSMESFLRMFASELHRGLLPSLRHLRYIPSVIECCLSPEKLDGIKILFHNERVSFSCRRESLTS